jgi:hypothetical protein
MRGKAQRFGGAASVPSDGLAQTLDRHGLRTVERQSRCSLILGAQPTVHPHTRRHAMIQFSRSMQPLLIGSVVLLSLACRQDERSNPSDTTGSESARGSQNSQYTPPPSTGTEQRPSSPDLGRSQVDRDQMNRNDTSGTQRMEERMPVAGRDDAIELGNGGTGGKSGKNGTGGSHH